MNEHQHGEQDRNIKSGRELLHTNHPFEKVDFLLVPCGMLPGKSRAPAVPARRLDAHFRLTVLKSAKGGRPLAASLWPASVRPRLCRTWLLFCWRQNFYQNLRPNTHATRSRKREAVGRIWRLISKRGKRHCLEEQFQDDVQGTVGHDAYPLSVYPGFWSGQRDSIK